MELFLPALLIPSAALIAFLVARWGGALIFWFQRRAERHRLEQKHAHLH